MLLRYIKHKEDFRAVLLSEFLDVAEFQVGDDEEYHHHNSQSYVVLPQAPGAVLNAQVVQVLLSATPETTHVQRVQPVNKTLLCAGVYSHLASCAHSTVGCYF